MQKKTMAQERASHLAMQARRDGLARLRQGKIANIHLVSGETVRVRPYDHAKDELVAPWTYEVKRVIILHNRRLVAVRLHGKNCELGIYDGAPMPRNRRDFYRGTRRLHYSDVLGVVLEGVLL